MGVRTCRLVSAAMAGIVLGAATAAGSSLGQEPYLADLVQLTHADQFARAGEAYFSPDGRWIIFQAVPAGGTTGSYSMYIARLVRDDRTGLITGLDDIEEVSPPGAASTCGWFHPTRPGQVLFGSAVGPLSDAQPAGYSRDRSRYTWAFPREMNIMTRTIRRIVEHEVREPGALRLAMASPDLDVAVPLWEQDGYTAEASWSADGRAVLYTWVDPATGDADIYARILETGEKRPLVVAPGYDGGPFFSPDGRWICYRSDRQGNNLLQLFVAELALDDRGLPAGIVREVQLTDNDAVNWAPFWHPDGRSLVFASSLAGHDNYEVFAIPFDPADPGPAEPVRITSAPGFDGLPVFNARGSLMMWTAQRGEDRDSAGRPSSQLWIARTTARSPAGSGVARPAIADGGGDSSGGGSMAQLRVRFGIMPGNYDDTVAGVAVADASPGGSAEAAGIRAGDRLVSWNGAAIRDVRHWMEFLMDHEPGDVVTVGVLRAGARIDISVTLQGR